MLLFSQNLYNLYRHLKCYPHVMKPLFKFAKYMGQYLSLNKAKSQQFSRNRFKVFFFKKNAH